METELAGVAVTKSVRERYGIKPVAPVAAAKAEAPSRFVPIKKLEAEQQIVFGEVYSPAPPDSQGDFMSADTIREMAYDFMKNRPLTNLDVQHSRVDCGAVIVESFIARDDDPLFIPGSWVIGVWCPDEVWELVKSGELNGFSLDGFGLQIPQTIVIELPEVLKGETSEVNGHKHMFMVSYAEDGTFLGGVTTEVDGHKHAILRGTVTEDANGHNHRFDMIEGMLTYATGNV